jgi:hypothetical protein
MSQRDEPNELPLRAHRLLIGFLGLLLPLLVWLFAGGRPTEGLPRWALLDSVSAYYYTGGVSVFVGVVFALSLFLFTYPGYKGVLADRLVAFGGGLTALGVALFPTSAPRGATEPTWWTPAVGVIHYVSAISLFVSFFIFAFWLFRRSDVPKGGTRPTDKVVRDTVCLVCALAMIVCVIWAVVARVMGRGIFWPESFAIEAFAISWLTKGAVHELPGDAKRFFERVK